MSALVTISPGAPGPSSLSPPPRMHLVDGVRPLAFVVEGSRLFALDRDFYTALESGDRIAENQLFEAAGAPPLAKNFDSELPSPSAISLNISQSCNLSCSYCYADEGRFGGRAKMMPLEVAFAAIDRLIDGSAGRRVTVGFIGGEPFLNRPVMYRSVDYARRRARVRGVVVGFSVTTNGTLINTRDINLLRDHAFAVSVSLDGNSSLNDRHRRGRGSSFEQAVMALRPLLENPGKARIAARATVTRGDLCVNERIEALANAGFVEVGVSPLRTSPDPSLVLRGSDWARFLEEMIRAAENEWSRIQNGASFRFSNLATAMKQLHAGSSKPFPCGSAANYVSVSADGGYFTCHRTIDDARFTLGSTTDGLSTERCEEFLQSRHVDRQEPCRACWARYLCGGGCHAEVLSAGRSGCDFIRGWLEYCLQFYDRVLHERPDLLAVNG